MCVCVGGGGGGVWRRVCVCGVCVCVCIRARSIEKVYGCALLTEQLEHVSFDVKVLMTFREYAQSLFHPSVRQVNDLWMLDAD